MLDTAQRTKIVSLLANDAYANIAAVNAAAAAVDLKDFLKERALLTVFNEDAASDTTVAVESSDDGSTSWTAVAAAALTNPVTGAATTLANLNTAGIKTIGVDLRRCKRYLRIQAAVELGATVAIGAALLGQYLETPKS